MSKEPLLCPQRNDAEVQLIERIKSAQEKARRARRGMWEYGDIGDDDDDSERAAPQRFGSHGARGRRR